ncbi:MAG: aldo/keto reductase [Deltaproteobacteria bacterium]|nr:aldo/keto reductase [Deltaproteobacteria bacterium]
MLPSLPFGRTGHESKRLIFGAAALRNVSQEEADRALELLLAHGVNHIDAAPRYGDAELRVGPWMTRHRDAFFLATKTDERGYAEARAQIRRSLERLQTSHLDLIQLHNLVEPDGWEIALGDQGALRAALEAREEGLVRFIGVTGHGTKVARMHMRSLERFAFDSVLLPYNPSMMAQPEYAADFERLLATCQDRGLAVQTIKSLARRRWREGETATHPTWYAPFTDPADIRRAVHWALGRPGIFVNSAASLSLLPAILEAAASFEAAPDEAEVQAAAERLGVEPLFLRRYAATSAQKRY